MQEATLPTGNRSILVAIDSQVSDVPHLLRGVVAGVRAIVLDPTRDGIEQLVRVLNGERFEEVHILSHGTPGCLYLGNSQLSLETLDRYRNSLQTGFSQTSGLFVYGCNVAAGDAGAEFVAKLHQLAQADVAASANLTGSSALGGDWNLDVRTGEMDVTPPLSPQAIATYAGVLVANAANDAEATDADTPVTIDVTGNDTGIDLTVTIGGGTTTAGASISVVENNIQYNPATSEAFQALPEGVVGPPDNFTYVIFDTDGTIDNATVAVTVTGVNDAPVVDATTATTQANQVFAGTGLLGNATDPDTGETASLIVVPASLTTAQGATVVVNADGTYLYDPTTSNILTALPEGTPATDSFTYEVQDVNGATGTGSVTVTINGENESPIANDDTATTLTNTPIALNVLGNDSDPDGTIVNIFPLPFSTTSAAGGSASTGNALNTLVYTPPQGFTGEDTFTYTITDGRSSSTATVTVTVEPPPPPNNDPIAEDDSFTINQDSPISIEVLANDSDPDDDPIGLISFTAPSAAGGTITREGNILTYTPPPGFTGNDGFQYVIQDDRGARDTGGVFFAIVSAGAPPTPPPGEPGGPEQPDIPNVAVPTPVAPPLNPPLDTVSGSDLENILLGNDSNNEFLALEGNDLVVGLAGNDNLFGNGGDDRIFANLGNDFLEAGSGNDQMFGGRDNDFLDGGVGDDTLLGDLGNDSILGGEGNDSLFGLQGNDVIDGGVGDDAIDGGDDSDALRGSDGNDTISGGAGVDALQGDFGDDMIFGNADDDAIDGANGNDSLFGGQGTDTLFGGSGNDRIDGSVGEDLLFGGSGNDTFVLAPGNGVDNIFDFVSGEDTLLLTGGLAVDQLSILPLENATAIVDLNTDTVLVSLLGVPFDDIGVDDFTN
ncbi:MAG: Ig-like domain-containing protein [Cyanobacteriota bacterium]|nr:Ig-like domain-containing protein [Cyanobacteriota bacterium]